MSPNREGCQVPQAKFRVRTDNGEWQTLTTDAVFKDRTVVAFSLPGAFTPTCSSMHVPRYNELAPAFYANGVDRVVCISVNDAFVMDEWARVQECGNVLMLPDWQWRIHRQDGYVGRQDRAGLQSAFLALLDAR